MEKKVPHYPLERVLQLVQRGDWRVTFAARKSASHDFQLTGPAKIREFILALERKCFYKSMTSYDDHKTWQDVYHIPVGAKMAYVKIQIVQDVGVVISFKTKGQF